MSFQWKERYNLNIPEIDAQHKKLFQIGKHAYELAMLRDNYDRYDEIMGIIGELLDYTRYHFGYEEKFMTQFGSEELNKQQQEHRFYVEKIKSFSEESVDEDQHKAVIDILDFLSEWISSHIMISDRKYAIEYKNRAGYNSSY